MSKSRPAIALLGLFAIAMPYCSASLNNQGQHASNSNQTYTTSLLKALASIPEWASDVETVLKRQGTQIDQTKAKQTMLPYVIVIQGRLSALEDLNNKLVEDLNTKSADRRVINGDLNELAATIRAMNQDFSQSPPCGSPSV